MYDGCATVQNKIKKNIFHYLPYMSIAITYTIHIKMYNTGLKVPFDIKSTI